MMAERTHIITRRSRMNLPPVSMLQMSSARGSTPRTGPRVPTSFMGNIHATGIGTAAAAPLLRGESGVLDVDPLPFL